MESDQAKAAGNQNWYVLILYRNILKKRPDHLNVNYYAHDL